MRLRMCKIEQKHLNQMNQLSKQKGLDPCLDCGEKRHVEDVGPDGIPTIGPVPDVVVQHRATAAPSK